MFSRIARHGFGAIWAVFVKGLSFCQDKDPWLDQPFELRRLPPYKEWIIVEWISVVSNICYSQKNDVFIRRIAVYKLPTFSTFQLVSYTFLFFILLLHASSTSQFNSVPSPSQECQLDDCTTANLTLQFT